MKEQYPVPDFLIIATEAHRKVARYAGTESVKFFKNSFVKGGFTDNSFAEWAKGLSPLASSKPLFKSGALMRSIHKTEANVNKIVVVSDTPYSDIHNNGGTIIVTAQMKKFFWAKYYEFAGNIKTTGGGKVSKSISNKKISAKAEFCRAMALKKVGSKIKIKKTQFMGHSKTMMQEFEKFYIAQIQQQFK